MLPTCAFHSQSTKTLNVNKNMGKTKKGEGGD